jgi:NAD(P)-dependent dehydrogenase (short-subunit alcohol dehydrogenase family)
MNSPRKTAIVTGASQGIGAGIVKGFVERGFNVVANSRKVTQSTEIAASDHVALVDGPIGEPATAARIVETALSRFKSIDALVNNAGIFFTKPFTDYTAEDLKSLVATNVEGFLYITQLAIKQMLAQKTGGSIVTITAALAANPIAGVKASVPMITKGGLDTITKHLAIEYARDGIRFNAVAPGVVDTPLHKNDRKEALQTLNPMGVLSSVKDIVDAVMYLTEAQTVTGEILNVDSGAHAGRW